MTETEGFAEPDGVNALREALNPPDTVPVPRGDLRLLMMAAERGAWRDAPPGSRLNEALKRCAALLDDGLVTVSREDLRTVLPEPRFVTTEMRGAYDRLAAAAGADQ